MSFIFQFEQMAKVVLENSADKKENNFFDSRNVKKEIQFLINEFCFSVRANGKSGFGKFG